MEEEEPKRTNTMNIGGFMHYREKRISSRSVNCQGTAIEQYRKKIPNRTPGYVLYVLVKAKDIGEET